MEKIETKQIQAEELRKKQNDELKDKVSEHAAKIEKAQQALEAAIEDAKEATKAAIEKKMNQVEEKKSGQLEEMLTVLKDHSEKVQNVRSSMEVQMKPKAQQIVENMAKKVGNNHMQGVGKSFSCIRCPRKATKRSLPLFSNHQSPIAGI